MQMALPPQHAPHGAAPQGAAPQGVPSGLGFPLVPGERVVFAKRPKSALTGLYIAGVLLSWMFGIGFILLIMAIVAEKNQGKLFAVTTHRLVLLDGNARETSYWFQNYRDVEPTRRDLNVGGGGLIGGLISAAATAVADSRLANQHKLQPQFWTRTIALNFTEHSGRRVTADLGEDGEHVALPVAHVFLGNAGPQMPTFDVRFLAQQPSAVPGVGLTILGALLTFYGLVTLAVFRLGMMFALGALGTPFALVMVAAGAGLFTLGIFTRLKAKKARGEAGSPAVPLALFGVFTTAAVVGAFVYKKKGYEDYDSRPRPIVPAAKTSPTGTTTALAAGNTAAQPGKVASTLADLDAILARHNLPRKPDHGFETGYSFGAHHASAYSTEHMTKLEVWTIEDAPRPAAPNKYCAIGAKAAVCVDPVGAPTGIDAKALSANLAKRPLATKAAVLGALRAEGLTVTQQSGLDNVKLDGWVELEAIVKKGATEANVYILEFADALDHPEDDDRFKIVGKQIVFVSTDDGALRDPLLNEVLGKK